LTRLADGLKQRNVVLGIGMNINSDNKELLWNVFLAAKKYLLAAFN